MSSSNSNPRVYFDVAVNDFATQRPVAIGRVVMELYADAAPRTAENFRCLCTGEKGKGASGRPLHYKGNVSHRIIPGFMIQLGDTTHGNGTGGESIYGRTFRDETFAGKAGRHTPFCLSMANSGPHTNGSQIFITTAPTPHLDGKHVVFGRVVEGQDVVRRVEKEGTPSGKPRQRVTIVACGELKTEAAVAVSTGAVSKRPTGAQKPAALAAAQQSEDTVAAATAAAAAAVRLALERAAQLERHADRLVARAAELRRRAGLRHGRADDDDEDGAEDADVDAKPTVPDRE